ncbi:MAG: hypothetical protein MRZ65_09075 [Lachnospiraceae bacterium]|nr:hypothetical protein [Lachnospiraceae bacterium]
MKGKTKKLACYMLVFSLLITSITTAYVNKPMPVKGGELVLAYTAEEVMLAIMAGLGLSVADYGIQTSQDDLENAKAFYEECQYWEEVDKEYLNKAIETAQTTGQVVIDKASGVWEKLKTQFGEFVDEIKSVIPNKDAISFDDAVLESMCNLSNADNTDTNAYIINIVSTYWAHLGKTFTKTGQYRFNSFKNKYGIIARDNGNVYFMEVSSLSEFKQLVSMCESGEVSCDFYFNYSLYQMCLDGRVYSYNQFGSPFNVVEYTVLTNDLISSYGILTDKGYNLNSDYADNYDVVYHPPTVGDVTHAYDIITPENTAEKDEDGTYKIGGAYVIDVANPVTYPVDLTDGQTIPDEKSEIGTIPITDIVKVNEKTDTGDEDNKTEDTGNTGGSTKPIVPDVSSGDIPDMAVLKTLFPFCIPFDIADSIKLMQADAVAPKWTIKINIPIGKKTIPFEFTIDMSILDEQVKIFRDGQVVIFIIGLAFATTKVIKWGASEE